MDKPLKAAGRISCRDEEILRLFHEAKEEIDSAYEKPPKELKAEVDRAEVKIVRLRDCLIHRLRQEGDSTPANRWRSALDRANVALSFVVGVEYPATGIHRNALDKARQVLNGLAGEME